MGRACNGITAWTEFTEMMGVIACDLFYQSKRDKPDFWPLGKNDFDWEIVSLNVVLGGRYWDNGFIQGWASNKALCGSDFSRDWMKWVEDKSRAEAPFLSLININLIIDSC